MSNDRVWSRGDKLVLVTEGELVGEVAPQRPEAPETAKAPCNRENGSSHEVTVYAKCGELVRQDQSRQDAG
jgi:hypothetical protein